MKWPEDVEDEEGPSPAGSLEPTAACWRCLPSAEVAAQFTQHCGNGSRAGIMISRAAGPAFCAAWSITRSSRPHAISSAAMDWTLPRSGRLGDSVITPLVVTGHQPELFHPGVWVKNFATAALARAHGGLGLNLIVDNDLPKSASIRVPRVGRRPIRTVRVEFDQWKGEMPYEDLTVHDEALFASFGDRVRQVLGGVIADPIIDDFWPRAVRQAQGQPTLGMRLARPGTSWRQPGASPTWRFPSARSARPRASSGSRPTCWPSFPDSRRSTTRPWPSIAQVYGIRSKNHPVSALGMPGEWREAPFWVWRRGNRADVPLLVRQAPPAMLLRIAGEDDPLIELPLSPDREACCAVERLHELARPVDSPADPGPDNNHVLPLPLG